MILYAPLSYDILKELSIDYSKKFKKIQNSVRSYIYPSTVFELVKLNETEYNRLFERNLFSYMNTHESWDNYTQDAPVMKALAELDDEEYETLDIEDPLVWLYLDNNEIQGLMNEDFLEFFTI